MLFAPSRPFQTFALTPDRAHSAIQPARGFRVRCGAEDALLFRRPVFASGTRLAQSEVAPLIADRAEGTACLARDFFVRNSPQKGLFLLRPRAEMIIGIGNVEPGATESHGSEA